ncbi:MAG: amidase family protein [Myxococcota bacterium]
MTAPLHTLDATALLELMGAGEASSREIVEALHARADQVEPRVGAFAHQLRREALDAADAADAARSRGELAGPLHGLPLTIKESVDVAGIPSTLGMVSRKDRPAASDAVVVRRLREEGALVLGKTNVPQTLLAPLESTNRLFGTTHNPWRHGHGPGGSSGGEAAALAAGTSALGIGTDIGGSIRTPAALCGVFGLKPTVDRWSNVGSRGLLPGQELVRSQIGPMARSVRDLALLMATLDAPSMTPHDPRVPPVPTRRPPERPLVVGYYEDDGFLTPAASVRRAVREAAEALDRAGCRVERFTPPNVEEIVWLYFAGLSADGLATLDEALAGEALIDPIKTVGRLAHMPRRARQGLARAMGLMQETRVEKLIGALGEKRVKELWDLTARRTELKLEEQRAWDRAGVDVVLSPVYATPACPIGMSHDFTLGFASVSRYNFLDRPAGVVPVSRVRTDETVRSNARDRVEKRAEQIESQSAGLPLAVQVVGRPWDEATVLRAMALLEGEVRGGEAFPTTPVDPR